MCQHVCFMQGGVMYVSTCVLYARRVMYVSACVLCASRVMYVLATQPATLQYIDMDRMVELTVSTLKSNDQLTQREHTNYSASLVQMVAKFLNRKSKEQLKCIHPHVLSPCTIYCRDNYRKCICKISLHYKLTRNIWTCCNTRNLNEQIVT